MALSSSVKTLLHEKKYPFFFTLSILFLSVTLLLISNSDYSSFFTFSSSPNPSTFSLLQQSDHQSTSPPPALSDPPPENNKSQDREVIDPVSDDRTPPPQILPPPPPPPPETVVVAGEIEYDEDLRSLKWGSCKGPSAVDYIPCLDNFKAIKALKSRRHMEHRERHCPKPSLRCLVPLPKGYKVPVPWPKSRDMIWYDNVPHPKLVDYKKDQNWVVKSGEYFEFPGGGTQFKEGVRNYIQFIEKAIPVISWGQNIRVILDVGCGVASFGGHLLDRDVLTMSLAPKDEHEAQIQFALERGIPAILSVIGTQQLTFPDDAYDLIHCARCRVHWDADGTSSTCVVRFGLVFAVFCIFGWSCTS